MTSPIPTPVDPQPVDFIVGAACAAGWPAQDAFEAALQLLAHGVTVEEARRMFAQASRWIQ